MDSDRLSAAVATLTGHELAADLVRNLISIRYDLATRTLERATSGKFVETFVQCLQQIATGQHDDKPSVDEYLDKKVAHTSLPEGLRVCAARVARAMYTLRNKRNVAHKNDVDANTHDLALAYQSAAWIAAELLRNAIGLSMEEAGRLIQILQTPVGTLVEEIGVTRIVLADVSARAEILILLHSYYPDAVSLDTVLRSTSRRNAKSVKSRLRELHAAKLAHGATKSGYRLTQQGYQVAVAEINKLAA